jgi:hypothetical protein
MSRPLFALAAACTLAASAVPALADGPASRHAPNLQSPTDEYVPPARTPPRAQRTLRRAPGGTSLSAYIRSLPTYRPPPSLGDMAPASGAAYFHATPSASTYYYYPYRSTAPNPAPETAYPPVPPGVFTRQDFDGAPCPTRSRTSLGELFACTR